MTLQFNLIHQKTAKIVISSLFLGIMSSSLAVAGEPSSTRTTTGPYGGSRTVERTVEEGQGDFQRTIIGPYGGTRNVEGSVENGTVNYEGTITGPYGETQNVEGTVEVDEAGASSTRTITGPYGGSRVIQRSR